MRRLWYLVRPYVYGDLVAPTRTEWRDGYEYVLPTEPVRVRRTLFRRR